MENYPLAPDGIFRTIQGEGALLGVPMTFVRLAGCSIGCKQCDTIYSVKRRATAREIGMEVAALGTEWTWVTGGEPADYELWPLLEALRLCGRIALATSGYRGLRAGGRLVDFLSVSPHGKPAELVLNSGNQLNLVPGLNGLRLEDWETFDAGKFDRCYVTPCDGRVHAVEECREWVDRHPGWRLGIQAHKTWGIA